MAAWTDTSALDRPARLAPRAGTALPGKADWLQLARFAAVGASGYAVNLAVYAALLVGGLHFRVAAVGAFAVAVVNNYAWNRRWTFPERRGRLIAQGSRFLCVALAALGANVALLSLLVAAGLGALAAQAAAIVLVTPISFLGHRLWSFR